MPNKSYPESNYYRPQCAQQNPQQYTSYPVLPNNSYPVQQSSMYDLMYQARSQYPQSSNQYEHFDNWIPDTRLVNDGLKFPDKMETIEISSKDLSPASCYSNNELLLTELYNYTNNKHMDTQWFCNTNNKNFTEYPSCSQVNCQPETNAEIVKYCSIQKPNYDCNQYQKDCNILNQIPDVFPSQQICQEVLPFNQMPPLDQQTVISNEESDIIVEDSEEEINEYTDTVERKFNCIVCNIVYSPVGNQFYFLTVQSPLTMSTQKPVYYKLKDLVGKFKISGNYLCCQCLGLINTIDHLELKLDGYKTEFLSNFEKTNKTKVVKKERCKHRFNCRTCKKVFTLENIYKSHLNRHKLLNRFLCEICGKRYTNQKLFKMHYQSHKTSERKYKIIKINAFVCKICSKPFRTYSHLKEHHNFCSGNLPYSCKTCNKQFPTSTKLKNHIRLKHDKKFTSICSICNIGFIKMYDYKSHMISHSTDKKYSCNKCDKSYKTISNLKFHMKYHDKKLPFICKICSKGFMRKEYWDSHMSTHSGEKNYACSRCDKKFVSQKNLDAHWKHHDGSIKKKSCNICGKVMSKGLEDHMRTHSNLKEFDCEKCDMKFNTKCALQKHRKRKHDDIEAG